jgi:hypothetical protein
VQKSHFFRQWFAVLNGWLADTDIEGWVRTQQHQTTDWRCNMTKTIEKIIISAAFLALVVGAGSGLELKAMTDFMVAGAVAVFTAPLLTRWVG